MTVSIIPISSPQTGAAWWKQRTQIDGTDYILGLQWLQRDGHWLLHLYDQDQSPIAVGIKLVPAWDLLGTVTDTRRPAGRLYLWDVNATGQDPTFSNLGVQFQLKYYDAAELAAYTSIYGSLAAVFGT